MHVSVCCAYFRESLIESQVKKLRGSGANIHLWALEGPLPAVADETRVTGLVGKFQALNHLLHYCPNDDLVLFIDDDVDLPVDFLPNYLAAVELLGVALAQPSLAAGSHHTYPISLAQPGCWARLTNFVECGPVVSMDRKFLDAVTPFDECNPMGWGFEAHWRTTAEAHGWPMAVIDHCTVKHSFRPIGVRYSKEEAGKQMERYLDQQGLTWASPRVLRKYPRLFQTREEYLAAFPVPGDAKIGGPVDCGGPDRPLVYAIVSLLKPKRILEIAQSQSTLTRTLLQAASSWRGKVVSITPSLTLAKDQALACEHLPVSSEEGYATWTAPVECLVIHPSTCDRETLCRQLDTWVKDRLCEGGVAIFATLNLAETRVDISQTIRGWLREQPRDWRWQEFAQNTGVGLLWRIGKQPTGEELLPRLGQSTEKEKPPSDSPTVRNGQKPLSTSLGGRPPRASLIIAAHNEGVRLERTVQACVQTSADLDCELVVVDDKSTDGSVSELRGKFSQVRLVSHARRRGGPAAKDLGARSARGDVLIFLDGHCKPEPRALAKLVDDVQEHDGKAIVTPRVPALDPVSWENSSKQVGHGFHLDLLTLHQKWIGLAQLRPRGRFYKSPALIGCCMALTHDLYDQLWGFDSGMLSWGTEDIDLGLKAWLCGNPVLHDPEATIGHVFQSSLGRYEVPEAHVLVNHLRLARKNFGDAAWHDWLEHSRMRQSAELWQAGWELFQRDRESVERERDYLLARRAHDEYWYARSFGLDWPPPCLKERPQLGGPDGMLLEPAALFELHQRQPRNRRTLADAQLCGKVPCPRGGELQLFLKVARLRSGTVVVDRAAFQCDGCDEIVPYASLLTGELEDQSLDDLRALRPQDLCSAFARNTNHRSSRLDRNACVDAPDIEKSLDDTHPACLTIAALHRALDRL
jgi:GT2 family glycosyltransferase